MYTFKYKLLRLSSERHQYLGLKVPKKLYYFILFLISKKSGDYFLKAHFIIYVCGFRCGCVDMTECVESSEETLDGSRALGTYNRQLREA